MPFVVILSSHLLPNITEVIVAPVLKGRTAQLPDLEIGIVVDGESLCVSLSGLTSVRHSDLRKRAGSLADPEDAIRRALDRLFTGF